MMSWACRPARRGSRGVANRSDTYIELAAFLHTMQRDKEIVRLLKRLCDEAGAEHLLYGYTSADCLVSPVLSTLPPEPVLSDKPEKVAPYGPLIETLRQAPRNIDLTRAEAREACGFEPFDMSSSRLEPISGHGFIGAFGEVAGVLFCGYGTGRALVTGGSGRTDMFERRNRLARKLHAKIQGWMPARWPRSCLSNREGTCLHMAAAGLSAARTGELLGVSKRTVEDHLAAARTRLGTRNGAATLALAVQRGYIRPLHAPARFSYDGGVAN